METKNIKMQAAFIRVQAFKAFKHLRKKYITIYLASM